MLTGSLTLRLGTELIPIDCWASGSGRKRAASPVRCFRKRRFILKWPTINAIVKRTLGGFLMGLGALLIPGGNDTLLNDWFSHGAWQAALAYVLFIVTLGALIAKFGSMARSWS
jgi:hypothetical protein